jgi:hypothetical protein
MRIAASNGIHEDYGDEGQHAKKMKLLRIAAATGAQMLPSRV